MLRKLREYLSDGRHSQWRYVESGEQGEDMGEWVKKLGSFLDSRDMKSGPVEEVATTDEALAEGVRAWFGDTDCPPIGKDFINRMRAAMLAALLCRMKGEKP